MSDHPAAAVTVPGLPDVSYAHDGQLTKWETRAVTLAALSPRPGELLWDVGAGSGSIGIEWSRSHDRCRAVAIEADAERASRIRGNAEALGVPGLRVVVGAAPDALDGIAAENGAPDAVFIGGGLTVPGVVERCWAALRPGGRLVANAVTAETEAAVVGHRAVLGGELTRIQISRSSPVGRFTGWRALMPVTQWLAIKNEAEPDQAHTSDGTRHGDTAVAEKANTAASADDRPTAGGVTPDRANTVTVAGDPTRAPGSAGRKASA